MPDSINPFTGPGGTYGLKSYVPGKGDVDDPRAGMTRDQIQGLNDLSVGDAGLGTVAKQYGNLASQPGQWPYGYGPHGGPILPGWGEYTGAQHELGGMGGIANMDKLRAAQAAGVTPQMVAAWLQTADLQKRMSTPGGMPVDYYRDHPDQIDPNSVWGQQVMKQFNLSPDQVGGGVQPQPGGGVQPQPPLMSPPDPNANPFATRPVTPNPVTGITPTTTDPAFTPFTGSISPTANPFASAAPRRSAAPAPAPTPQTPASAPATPTTTPRLAPPAQTPAATPTLSSVTPAPPRPQDALTTTGGASAPTRSSTTIINRNPRTYAQSPFGTQGTQQARPTAQNPFGVTRPRYAGGPRVTAANAGTQAPQGL